MLLISLLIAIEKQLHFGWLHMRPIQWHVKNHWRIPESLEKEILIPRSLDPHLKWWLQETNVFQSQSLHLLSHVLKIFTDASRSLGCSLMISQQEGLDPYQNRLHINYLKLKAVFLALKSFKTSVQTRLCS